MTTPYPSYRRYDTDWLPELPTHWRRQKMKYLTKFMVSGGTPSTANDGHWGGDIPWVSPKDMKTAVIIETEDYITREGLHGSAARLVPPQTLLMVVRSGILRHSIPTALSGKEVAVNQDIKAVGFTKGISPAYIRHYIDGLQSELLARWTKTGTTVESIETEFFANDEFPVPPLDEQAAIADFLDRETARIDALIERKRRLLELLEEKRLAVITHAVTKGLDPSAPMKDSGIDWLGQIPAHWEVKRLKFVGSVLDCKHVTPTYVDEGYPLVSTTEIKPFSITFSDARRVDEEEFLDMTAGGRLPTRGDIIYSRNVSVGSAARVRDTTPFCMGQDLCLIRPEGGDSGYLEFVLNSRAVLSQIDSFMVGATFKRINVDRIRNFWLPVPPSTEQSAIAQHIQSVTERLLRIKLAIEAAVSCLQEYRSALITNAVTGKIDVREAAQKEAAE